MLTPLPQGKVSKRRAKAEDTEEPSAGPSEKPLALGGLLLAAEWVVRQVPSPRPLGPFHSTPDDCSSLRQPPFLTEGPSLDSSDLTPPPSLAPHCAHGVR